MKMSVRPELTTAPPARVRDMRHTDGAVDNSALLPNHPGSTYKSGNAVQTAGATSTFDFLGFTHCCGVAKDGKFQVVRLTMKKRMRATLDAIRSALMRRRHQSTMAVGKWLNRVIQGYFNYHAVPGSNLYR